MAQFAKKAIKDTFVRLIEKKPLDKITVKDIVEECGVTRNTFYYYFQDIYDVLEELFDEETERISHLAEAEASWDDVVREIVKFAEENRKVAENLYRSPKFEEISVYFDRFSEAMVKKYMDSVGDGIKANDLDRRLIVSFYSHAVRGFIEEWLRGQMKEKPEKVISRIGELLRGSIAEALRRSAEESTK